VAVAGLAGPEALVLAPKVVAPEDRTVMALEDHTVMAWVLAKASEGRMM